MNHQINGIEEDIFGSLSKGFPGIRKKSIIENILLFCRVLKSFQIDVTTGMVLDAVRSLKYIDLSQKDEVYFALRSNLISESNNIQIFDKVFRAFWLFFEQSQAGNDRNDLQRDFEEFIENECFTYEYNQEDLAFYEADQLEKKDIGVYSPIETLRSKDFSAFTDEDIEKIKDEIIRIADKIATRKSRRKRIDSKGKDLSLKYTLRKSMRYGGEIFEFAKTSKKIKKIKLVAIADVSGSMDCYSNFFFQFLYGLQQRLKRVEIFVFSTRLSRITEFFNNRSMDEVLGRISERIRHWSGGTKIGFCLETFNHDFASYVLDDTSVVIIISDGWDRGDTDLLEREMKRLRDNCHEILWLNPLLSNPNYQPLCRGIQAALPYISYFLPFYNLNSLMDIGKVLRSI